MTIKRSIAKGNPKTFKFIFVLKPPKFLLKNFGVQENRSIRKFYEFSMPAKRSFVAEETTFSPASKMKFLTGFPSTSKSLSWGSKNLNLRLRFFSTSEKFSIFRGFEKYCQKS